MRYFKCYFNKFLQFFYLHHPSLVTKITINPPDPTSKTSIIIRNIRLHEALSLHHPLGLLNPSSSLGSFKSLLFHGHREGANGEELKGKKMLKEKANAG